jgi:hypothetical protein
MPCADRTTTDEKAAPHSAGRRTVVSVVENRHDLMFMLSPLKWPQYPLLPLKHKTLPFGDKNSYGTLVYSSSGPHPFTFLPGVTIFDTTVEWEKVEQRTGKAKLLTELCEEGWMVD